MIVDLVHTTAADGARLDGALHEAPANAGPPAVPLAVDALLCLPGVGANFYGSRLLERLSPPLVDAGLSLLWANTRGHDAVSHATVHGAHKRQGAAYEIVDDCRHDVRAWLEFLQKRGFRRLGVLGHSLGAIKALYALAHEPHAGVQRLVAVSPPRLSHAAFRSGLQSAAFFEALATAQQHVDAGRSDALIEARFPFPLLITAGGYVDKYGPAERYNIVKFAGQVAPPTLFVYGEQELASGNTAFAGVPDALAAAGCAAPRFQFVTINGADHMYSSTHRQLAQAIIGWLAGNAAGVD